MGSVRQSLTADNTSKTPVKDFDELLSFVQSVVAGGAKPRTALVLPHESEMVSSFRTAIELDLIDPFVVGDEALFRDDVGTHNINPDKVQFIDINQPEMAVITAAQMGARGELDFVLKGRMSAEAFLRLLFEKQTGFVNKRKRVVHLTVMKPASYPKLLSMVDAGIAVSHEIEDLVGIIEQAALFLIRLGIERPRTAALAAVEVVYPQMKPTVKAAVLSVMARRGQIRYARIDGPLSFDVAIDVEVATAKGITDSEVAGQADLLLAPDLSTANGIYKAMSLFGDCPMGAVSTGAAIPFTMSAFCDSEETRFNSILLGILASN